jgi:hypothetical protein
MDHHLPRDDMIYTVGRLLPLETSGPDYHVKTSDGALRLIYERQLAPTE